MKAVAPMIEHRLDNIIIHCHHQLTNAVAEVINIRNMAIRGWAGSHLNVANIKAVIFSYCAGLQLYP